MSFIEHSFNETDSSFAAEHLCRYSAGEMLFGDLHVAIGKIYGFRNFLQDLYRRISAFPQQLRQTAKGGKTEWMELKKKAPHRYR